MDFSIRKIRRIPAYCRYYVLGLLKKYGQNMPDKLYVSIQYFLYMGKFMHWNNPKTFNEKLQWLKLYNRKPEYTMMVDKYAVKDYVAGKIGREYIIPTLGVWDNFDDIPFDELPNQFVLKTTHGGGSVGVVICKDKDNFNVAEAKGKIEKSMRISGYEAHREWPYKNVRRRIIAEQFIAEPDGQGGWQDLKDYKFFCFDGEVKAMFIASDRQNGKGPFFDYFDADFNHLDLVQTHPMSGKAIEKPLCFEEMKRVASELSKGIPQVRCDLYEVKGRVYFGELTFTHHGGVVPFHPESWDYIWGAWITLPPKP